MFEMRQVSPTGRPQHEERQRRFIALYVAAERSVRRLLRLLVGDPGRLDDLCQMAALRMWELFDGYDPSRPFEAWARGVAAKVALEMHRSERRAGAVLSPEVVAAIADGLERDELQHSGTAEQLEALEECLAKLSPRTRVLIEMKYMQAAPTEEVAEGINKSVAMTYKLLQAAKRALADCIRRRLAAECK